MWPFKKKAKEFDMLTVAKESKTIIIAPILGFTKKQLIRDISEILGKNMRHDLEATFGFSLRHDHEGVRKYNSPEEHINDCFTADSPGEQFEGAMRFVHLPKNLEKKLRANETDEGWFRYKSLFIHFRQNEGIDSVESHLLTGIVRAAGRASTVALRNNKEDLHNELHSAMPYGKCPSCEKADRGFIFDRDGHHYYQCHNWHCEFGEPIAKMDWEKVYNLIRQAEQTFEMKFLKSA